MAILPIETRLRGPAPPAGEPLHPFNRDHRMLTALRCAAVPVSADPSAPDIVSEALDLFRANSLFRNFEIKGPADRVLIYLILFISDCLTRIVSAPAKGWTANEAQKQLTTLALDHFSLPGDADFPLNSLYAPPATRVDAGL
jgi:actin related protein 2/3 complex subunit 3